MMALNSFPVLQTNRLTLRKILPEDIQHIFKGLSNVDVIQYYGVSYDSLEATKAQMAWFENLEKTQTGIWWGIWSKQINTFMGAGGFNQWSQVDQKAEIGFWLLPEYWNQGIMQEAFPKLCAYGFEQMNLNRIEGFVEPENIKCKKAIEKLKFKLEGTMRSCEIKNGKFIDLNIYALLKNEA